MCNTTSCRGRPGARAGVQAQCLTLGVSDCCTDLDCLQILAEVVVHSGRPVAAHLDVDAQEGVVRRAGQRVRVPLCAAWHASADSGEAGARTASFISRGHSLFESEAAPIWRLHVPKATGSPHLVYAREDSHKTVSMMLLTCVLH